MTTWNFHYKSLDHWRGFAALWVMMFHGFATTYHKDLHPLVDSIKFIAASGWLGVNIFFVISGYCITTSAYKLTLQNESIGKFIKNRALRLLPVYWIAFVFAIIINLICSPLNNTGFWNNLPNSWQGWLGNIFLIQPYIDTPTYVIVYWSLVVEFAFYMLVALLLTIRHLIGNKTTIFIGLSLSFASPFIYIEKVRFLSLWGEFVCGSLLFLALLFEHKNNSRRRNLCLCLIVIMALIGFGASFIYHRSSQLWFSALFSLLLYYLYFFDFKLLKTTQIKWLAITGTFSYSLYLLHVPILSKIINLGSRFISSESLAYLLLQLSGWIIAITVSFVFYHLVEKPLNNWRYKYLSNNKSIKTNNKVA